MFFITFAPLKNVHFVLIFGTFRFADYIAAIYQRFAKILPTWQQWIERSFLSAEMKKQYSDLIIAKLAHW